VGGRYTYFRTISAMTYLFKKAEYSIITIWDYISHGRRAKQAELDYRGARYTVHKAVLFS